jgi:hypothetical protein
VLEDACSIIGYFGRRWRVPPGRERLHFTLKSGLRAERVQIDDARSLSHCLAIFYVIAWRLLMRPQAGTRYMARENPDRPAAEILSQDQIAVLEKSSGKQIVTLVDAVRETAVLGGYQYYRTAPPPGVKVLWLRWRQLTARVRGWGLARGQEAGGIYDA